MGDDLRWSQVDATVRIETLDCFIVINVDTAPPSRIFLSPDQARWLMRTIHEHLSELRISSGAETING
jgi:hypothetical protein